MGARWVDGRSAISYTPDSAPHGAPAQTSLCVRSMNARVAAVFLNLALACLAPAMARAQASPAAQAAQSTPIGFWNTIDDEDHRPTAVVEIRPAGDELVGIVRALLVPATHADSICGKCSGDRKDKPIVGMEILSHMRRHDDEWSGGEILDPETGKTYRAKLRLE